MISDNAIADLHIHSCASDGTDTPMHIITELLQKDIKIASLTDHNNVDNQNKFLHLAKKHDITAIPGVEISSKIGTMVYHILAYGFNPDDKRIPAYVDPLLIEMRKLGRKIIKKMADNYPEINLFEYDEYKRTPSLGGWKFIHYLHDKGIVEKPMDALSFRKIYNCHFYQCDYPSPKDAIEEIHSWEAYAVLAHPNSYFSKTIPDNNLITSLFDEMKDYGIDGVECYYPSHSDFMTKTAVEWCRRNDMIITVGCDSHGGFVPSREIGKIRIPLSDLNINAMIGEKQK